MQADITQKLRLVLSNERLAGYESRTPGDDDLDTFCHYAWNLSLSESLYPVLQCVEVALRNTIHEAARNYFGRDDWFDDSAVINHRFAVDTLASTKAKLQHQQRPLDAHRIVAELTFGFWTSLFARRYEQVLWPALIKTAFPAMPRRGRTRAALQDRFHEIRLLRNRIFHHEPIWYWGDLEGKHQRTMEALGWIEPAMVDLVSVVDRFPAVYADGADSIEGRIRDACC